MNRTISLIKHLRIGACIFLAVHSFSTSANSESAADTPNMVLKSYTANYVLRKAGMTIASLRQQLSVQNEHLEFTTYTKPKGIAALISSKPVSERNLIYISGGEINPELYSRRYTGKNDAKIKDMDIDYSKDPDNALVTVAGKKYKFRNEENLWDERSVIIATMYDLYQNKTDLNYLVIDDSELKEYHYTVESGERLDTAIGEQQAVKIVRLHGNRETYMWFAPELNYLLLKVRSYRKGKLKSELLLKSVTGELLSP